MQKINWTEIVTFYLSADTITLKNCAQQFQVSYDVIRQQASKEKWRQMKKQARHEMIQVALQKVIQENSIQLAQVNKNHLQLARFLQGGAIKKLAERQILPTTARDIQSWIKSSVKIERDALGMNQQTQPKIDTTENPKDELLLKDETQKNKTPDTAI
jgi:hypothetical protein